MSESGPSLPPRAMLVPVFVGLALVVCATLLVPWPLDGAGHGLVPHWDRLLGRAPVSAVEAAPSLRWLWARVWDGLHYVLLLGGLALALWAALEERPARARLAWLGLVAVGLLGTLYTGSMALYNGPLIATPGYLLIGIAAALTAAG